LAFWNYREELSLANRMRRSYYELLRDEVDQHLLQYALVDSYHRFSKRGIAYPFVERRELKPRARIPGQEYDPHNVFLVIFTEDAIPAENKKYIRFLDVNKTTKSNLLQSSPLSLRNRFDRNQKYLDSVHFFDFIEDLLSIDYALLIQRTATSGKRNRYSLSHFHVRIDWPIADAAEDLARTLRYISKDLYEKGEKYAEDLQKKFFEYYGMPVMVGGRRTAAIVAAQFMRRLSCIPTVYVSSSESRALLRISERGTAKSVLRRFSDEELSQLADSQGMSTKTFMKNYVVAREKGSHICIFQAVYDFTEQARPPDDGKLRELKPDLNFLSVGSQHIVPKPGVWQYPPLSTNLIYA
jgi:hypothetical protein